MLRNRLDEAEHGSGSFGLARESLFNSSSVLRAIAGRIAELIDLFERADKVLVQALGESLTRDELGLGEPAIVDDDDDQSA